MSCLTTSNLPWFMDLTHQVPMQYCSLQYWTLLPSPVTSTTGCGFCFGSVSSFFLELFLHWSPVAYWAPTDWGVHLSVSYFCLFMLFMGFSRQEFWSGLSYCFCPLLSTIKKKQYGTEAEDIKMRWQEYTEKLYKKDLHDPDNHDGLIPHQSQTSWNAKSSGP